MTKNWIKILEIAAKEAPAAVAATTKETETEPPVDEQERDRDAADRDLVH